MKRIVKLLVITLTVGVLVSCGFKSSSVKGVEGSKILVDSQYVIDSKDNIILVDYGRKVEDFEKGHIPGAIFLERSVTWNNVNGIDGMLPDVEKVVLDLEDAGISSNKEVVIYDGGNSLWASRLFWALEYLGHKNVHVLNGGITKWSENNDLSVNARIPDKGKFKANIQSDLIATKEWVLNNYNKENISIVDARSLKEYIGEDVRSQRGGHIPEAINIDWSNNLTNGLFKSVVDLKKEYESFLVNDDNVAVGMCQTGVRGAHTYLALRILGHKNPKVYDGSWEEWGNDLNTPINEGV